MKKSLIIFCVVLVLSLALIVSAFAVVSPKADDVTFTETTVFGDINKAEDISVDVHANLDYRLHWDITHSLSGKTETDFHFTQASEYPEHEYTYNGLLPNLDYNYHRSGSSLLLDDDDYGVSGYIEMVKDVMARATPNEDYTEKLYLRDYMEYLPVRADYDYEHVFVEYEKENELAELFADYFKIPVKDYTAEISVYVDSDGNLMSYGVYSPDIYGSYSSVLVGDKTYFTLGWRENNAMGETMDYSHVPGGYGIYCADVRFTQLENSTYREIDAKNSKLSTVYPLEDNQEVVTLTRSYDGENLLMFTYEDGESYMTVISLNTFETLQRIRLFDSFKDDEYQPAVNFARVLEKGIAVFSGYEKFDVLEYTNEGYKYDFSGDLTRAWEQFEEGYIYGEQTMDYDGDRFACAINLGAMRSCDFALALFDAEGMQYVGRFDCSLGIPGESNYGRYARLDDSKALEIHL